VTIAEGRDSMAKHAKPYVPEEQTYTIYVKHTFTGQVVVEAASLDEAVAIARDVQSDNKVSWLEDQVSFVV
jgi:hypothetical protein